MNVTVIHWSELDQKYWITDGDDVLWFEGSLEAKAAARQIELRRAAEEERAKIVTWLREESGCMPWIADVIEAGEHLK
jgi:hypothetical protein